MGRVVAFALRQRGSPQITEKMMKTADGEKMSGIPTATPGSAEGEDNQDEQSKVPPSSHTPGSAEGEDDPEKTGESS